MAEIVCSFCLKPQSEVLKLVQARDKVVICNECVAICVELMLLDGKERKSEKVLLIEFEEE